MKIIQSSCYLTFTANVTKIFLIEHCLESFGVQVTPIRSRERSEALVIV